MQLGSHPVAVVQHT